MNKKTAIAVLLAMAGIAISPNAPAAPLSLAPAAITSANVPVVTLVHGRNGSGTRGVARLRTFRTLQVARVRPVFGRKKVRPGRPLNLGRKKQGQLAYRKRPRRPRYIHFAGGAPPELPSALYEDRTREYIPLSPDFCRYWGDRGEVSGYWDLCW